MSFQDDFWWGTTSSSVQAEGVGVSADWSVWERDRRAPLSGEGSGFGTDFRDDLGLLADLGLSHVRLTLEWARIEPVKGKTDNDAIDLYRDMIGAARGVGLAVIATLAHTSLPGWFSDDEGGFLDESARNRLWTGHIGRCADLFGDDVAGWVPIEDPVGWAVRGHLLGSRPPGRRDLELALDAVIGALEANHAAWEILRSGPAPVIASHGAPTVFGTDPDAGPHADWWDDLLWTSWTSGLSDGELIVPEHPVRVREEWADVWDMIGLAFDHPIGVDSQGLLTPYPPDGRRADNGFAPVPEELGVALRRVAAVSGNRPILVSANGVSTNNDEWREQVLAESLDVVGAAIDDGVNITGYFHDTGVDGYEWRAGYETQRGLVDRDRNLKLSGATYSGFIRNAANPGQPRPL